MKTNGIAVEKDLQDVVGHQTKMADYVMGFQRKQYFLKMYNFFNGNSVFKWYLYNFHPLSSLDTITSGLRLQRSELSS